MKTRKTPFFTSLIPAVLAVIPCSAFAGGGGANNAGTYIHCADFSVAVDFYLAQQEGLHPREFSHKKILTVALARLAKVDPELYEEIKGQWEANGNPLEWNRSTFPKAHDALFSLALPKGCIERQASSFNAESHAPEVSIQTNVDLTTAQLEVIGLHEAAYMVGTRIKYGHTNPVLTQKLVGQLIARRSNPSELANVVKNFKSFRTALPNEPQGEFYFQENVNPGSVEACPTNLLLIRTGGYGVHTQIFFDRRETKGFRVHFASVAKAASEAETIQIGISVENGTKLTFSPEKSTTRCVYFKAPCIDSHQEENADRATLTLSLRAILD